MSRNSEITVLVAVKRTIVAFNKKTGEQLWTTRLDSGLGEGFVTLVADDARVYAHTAGELFCLDLATGSILWRNGLSGLGYGVASIAVPGASAPLAAILAQLREDGAAGVAATTANG